jgi:FkbM family methyltransferase
MPSSALGVFGAGLRHLPSGHPKAERVRGTFLRLSGIREGQLVYRNADGLEVKARLSDHMERSGVIGRYRLPKAVSLHLARASWVIDVGANVGLVASQLCRAVGREGQVWAFEPLPRNIEALEDLQRRNNLTQLQLNTCALGARESIEALRLSIGGEGGWPSFTKTWGVGESINVPVRTLDNVVDGADSENKVAFVKVDIEGYEPEFLVGAAKVMESHRPLVYCEFNDVLLRDAGSSSAALLAQFRDLDYVPVDLASRDTRLNEVRVSKLDGQLTDILLAHSSRVFRN